MSGYKYTDVFVPGGFPLHTYNPREELNLEQIVRQITDNLCKLATVTGPTKSGKTVLVRSILPRDNAIWVDGGAIGVEEDFWCSVVEQLEVFQSVEIEQSRENTTEVSASGSVGASLFVAKSEISVGGSHSTAGKKSSSKSRSITSRVAALQGLRKANRALVVDDFHYLTSNLQGALVRALKPLIFDGLPVVIIAIPHRRYDVIKVEKEMTGRILPVVIPGWTLDELCFIPDTGFKILHGEPSLGLVKDLSDQSIGSPHLMQEFCRAICREKGISTTFEGNLVDIEKDRLKIVFEETAETIGRPIFEKLARGPRQRKDRIDRHLKDGRVVDIYGLVLHALAHLEPGLITLEYEQLRTAIREVASQDVPQMHEVSRVLKHMSEIAATDQSSIPVIDFDDDDKLLHITDPFFAFFLRWGNLDS